MTAYEDVELHITIVARAQVWGYEGVEHVSEFGVEHVYGHAQKFGTQAGLVLTGEVVTKVMALVSEISEGEVMAYLCDEHPDRPAVALFTMLEKGNVLAMCGECVPLFGRSICEGVGWTVSEKPAAGGRSKVSAIGDGSKGKRRRPAQGTKDTGEPAGESTAPEQGDHCDAQVVEGCTGRGYPRPDLVDKDTPDPGDVVMCDPCYGAVKLELERREGELVRAWEDDGGTVTGHDDDELTGEQAAAAAATVTEG